MWNRTSDNWNRQRRQSLRIRQVALLPRHFESQPRAAVSVPTVQSNPGGISNSRPTSRSFQTPRPPSPSISPLSIPYVSGRMFRLCLQGKVHPPPRVFDVHRVRSRTNFFPSSVSAQTPPRRVLDGTDLLQLCPAPCGGIQSLTDVPSLVGEQRVFFREPLPPNHLPVYLFIRPHPPRAQRFKSRPHESLNAWGNLLFDH